nr:hypothetical protein [Candidatus Sigynarchaeota archaeon]
MSRFDDRVGPVILHSIPSLTEETLASFSTIPRLMDVIEGNNFFTHDFQNTYTANFFFEMPTQNKRGKMESVLLSIVFRVSIQDEVWIQKITAFLQEQKDTLTEMASTLKKDPVLNGTGLFNSENKTYLKRMLYEFYTRIFVQNARDLLVENVVHQNIWVLSSSKYDGLAALKRIKQAMDQPPRSIKKDLMQFLLSRLNFSLYNCEFRRDPIKACSICTRRYIESAACLFIFNVDDGDARGEIEDAIAHMNRLDLILANPFLVLGVDDGEQNDRDLTALLDISTSIKKLKATKVHMTQAIVNIDDFDTYHELIKWILSVVML